MQNFNETFRKDVSYDNIRSPKKQGFTVSLEAAFFKKPLGAQIDPLAFLGLTIFNNFKYIEHPFNKNLPMVTISNITIPYDQLRRNKNT